MFVLEHRLLGRHTVDQRLNVLALPLEIIHRRHLAKPIVNDVDLLFLHQPLHGVLVQLDHARDLSLQVLDGLV